MKKIVFLCLFVLLSFSKSFTYATTSDTLTATAEKIGAFDINLATSEYLNILSPEQKTKSDSYFEGGYWIQLWDLIFEIIIAWIFISLGLILKMKKQEVH